MENLDFYINKWQISESEFLAETYTSQLYKVIYRNKLAILKILKNNSDERNGALALNFFNGHGAVILLEYDIHAHLLEYVDGKNLKTLVQESRDEEATNIIGRVICELHSNNVKKTNGLTSLKDLFSALFIRSVQDIHKKENTIYVRAAIVAKSLLAEPLNSVVLHGDIHHENILESSKRGWLAIDPKGAYGESTYDGANSLCNPTGLDDLVLNEKRLLKNAQILSQYLKVDTSRLLSFTFVYAALSSLWSLEDGRNPSVNLKVAEIVEPHIKLN